MDLKEIRNVVKKQLSKKRYDHTIRVTDTAIELAKRYDECEYKVALAGLLHDYAKCKSVSELKHYMECYELPSYLLLYNKELWHGPVGAMIAKDKLGVKDRDILNAIYYHTTGRANMSQLELIIFIADYMEPARNFSGVEEVRKLAKENLQEAVRNALKNTIRYLLSKDELIYPDTFLAYNDLTKMGVVNN